MLALVNVPDCLEVKADSLEFVQKQNLDVALVEQSDDQCHPIMKHIHSVVHMHWIIMEQLISLENSMVNFIIVQWQLLKV